MLKGDQGDMGLEFRVRVSGLGYRVLRCMLQGDQDACSSLKTP